MAAANQFILKSSRMFTHHRRIPTQTMILLVVLLLTSLATNTEAWVPPKPGSGMEWESVHDMRRRLNLTFSYSPELLHPEICRYMTEHECQAGDENLRAHAKAHRALQSAKNHNPNIGTFKVSLARCCRSVRMKTRLTDLITLLYISIPGPGPFNCLYGSRRSPSNFP